MHLLTATSGSTLAARKQPPPLVRLNNARVTRKVGSGALVLPAGCLGHERTTTTRATTQDKTDQQTRAQSSRKHGGLAPKDAHRRAGPPSKLDWVQVCSLLHSCLVQVTRAESAVNASIGAAKVGSRSEWRLQLAVKASGAARAFVAVAINVVQVDFTCAKQQEQEQEQEQAYSVKGKA